jgi:hypothetical protein
MYELMDHGELTTPALIAAFDGWVSAGAAGTATADHVAGDGEVIARFSSDELFDYRVHRPALTFQDGVVSDVDWPEIIVKRRRVDDRDLLVMRGPEPNWHWQHFGEAVADLASDLGVIELISLGGIPWAAPHTRPTIVVTTSSRPELLGDDANLPPGQLRVPASVVSTLSVSVAERGIPTVGLWARVPHYVGGTYHPAVVTLVERLSLHLGVRIPLGSLVDDSAAQRTQLDEAVRDQDGVAEVVSQLEALYDRGDEVASGEEIAAEIERYLRDSGTEDRG